MAKIKSVCQLKKDIRKKSSDISVNISNKIFGQIDKHYNIIKNKGKSGIKQIKKLKKKGEKDTKTAAKKAANMYLKHPLRIRRPDISMFLEILVIGIVVLAIYNLWPYLTSSVKKGFSREQFNAALKLPMNTFSVQELAKVQLEVNSLKDYKQYLKINRSPYSSENSGIYSLMLANIMFPFVVLLLQFVVPPFVIGYIIWFCYTYWKYVWAAFKGWLIMLFKFFTETLQGKFGCKWYIRMMTGWSCNTPNFRRDFFTPWRRRYIDRPIYYEKLKYIKRYYWAKKHYYEIPWRKYIEIPIKRYKVKAKFAKKIFVDRSIQIFLDRLLGTHKKTYENPKKRLDNLLLSGNRNVAAVYAKMKKSKAQIEGKSYKSIDSDGNSCTCPAKKTPLSKIKSSLKKNTGDIKKDLDKLVEKTIKLYDSLNEVEIPDTTVDCKTVDNLISKRKSIAAKSLITIAITGAILFFYSKVFGTPHWLYQILTPSSNYIFRGLHVVNNGLTYFNWFWVYLIITVMTLVAIYFT